MLGDGSFDFNPALNYFGAVPVVTYTLTDGSGTDDTSTLTITVDSVNDQPHYVLDGTELQNQVVDLLHVNANEADGLISVDLTLLIADLESGTLAYSLVSITDTNTGRAVSVPFTITNGILTIDPRDFGLNLGETFDGEIVFSADDGSGAPNSSLNGVFDFHIVGSNDVGTPNTNLAPDAQSVEVNEDDQAPIVIDLNALVSDGDAGDILSITEVTLVGEGREGIVFQVVNGVIQFDPTQLSLANGDSQTLIFTYTVDDGTGAANSATDGSVTLNITGGVVTPPPPPTPNTAPDATDLVVSADANTTDIRINLLDLTSDIDGDDLTIQSVSIDIGGTPVTFSLQGGVLVVPWTQFVSISGSITTAFTYVVDDGTGTANSTATGHVNLTINGPFVVGNIAPVATETEQSVLVEDGVFVIDLNTLVSDGNGDPLTLSDVTLTYEVDGVATPISVPFTILNGVVTINPADFGLADGASLTAQLNFVVDDGTGAPNSSDIGSVTLTVTDEPAVPPSPTTQYVLDFEPFDNDGGSSTAITEYQGFHFLGSAIVFETDEVAGSSGGRDTGLVGVGNGQTTVGGTNVLVGGESPEHVFSIVAQGGDVPGVPIVTPNFGTAFSLDGLSLNAAFNNGLMVTITTYVLGSVDISGNFNLPPGTIFEDGLVVADTFDFIVDASTGASVINFDNFTDAYGTNVVGSTAFDNILWVDITSSGGTDAGLGGSGTQFVLDDILITV